MNSIRLFSPAVFSAPGRSPWRLVLVWMWSVTFSALALAQSGSPGVLTGRVLNPATGEYVRNAQIRIVETGQVTSSGDGGEYRISSVAPGRVNVTVTYTGYRTETLAVTIAAGATATLDFQLASSLERSADGSTLKLSRFVVSSEREGNAKAIMEQRNSMNITNSVASETFGDVSEGNIGEFLKHLPGVEIDLNADKAQGVRLRGLGTEYTSVTVDGISLAGSDANAGAAGNARAFNFEQITLSSLDSIEVFKTVSADQDANAPAGTINLRSKRAFDRKGRRIAWSANVSAFSEDFTFDRTYGPDDRKKRKLRPGGSLEYSDIYLNNRLGVVLNVTSSDVYSVFSQYSIGYNYTPTAADPRPAVVTTLNPLYGARTNEAFTATLTADFKATPNLVLSLGAIYNTVDLWYFMRLTTFTAVSRALVVGGDPMKSFNSGVGNGRVAVNPQGINKMGKNITYIPRFEYKRGDLTIDGRFAIAESESWYSPNSWDAIYNSNSPTLNNVTFQADRSHLSSADWRVVQTAGPDWYSGAGYTTPAIFIDDGRFAGTKIYSGDVSATLKTKGRFPLTWKTGVKSKREIRDFELERESLQYTYTGPGAGNGAWRNVQSQWPMDLSMLGASIRSSSGGDIFHPNTLEIWKLYQERPEYFTQTMTATNYYNAFIANKKHYVEDINAAFVMATGNVGKLLFRGGLRYESTHGDSLEFNPRPGSEVQAAGFPVTGGRATTIPGLEYQYLSRPRVHRKGDYGEMFPSAGLKYKFTDNIDAHFGYSRTIRRPTFRDVAGVWVVNEEALRVSAPNPNLKPEYSDNLSARLAYYFEPVGIVAANFYQNTVDGLFITSELSADEYGYTGDEDYSSYIFTTTTSGGNRTVVRGMELEYSQSLSFLPGVLKGLNARASYTRNYAEVILPLLTGHSFKAGLSYAWRGLSVYGSLNWHDNFPTNATGTTYRRHRTVIDAGGGYRLSDRVNLFFSLRNVFDAPLLNMQKSGTNPAVVTGFQAMGTGITLGVRGTF